MVTAAAGGALAIEDDLVASIVAFAFRAYRRPLTPASSRALTTRILDALGCAVAACREPEVQAVARAIGAGEKGLCSILLNGEGGAGEAAFLNGMMLRYNDWNDTYVGQNGGHPSDLIPVALAAGQHAGKSGDETLRALSAGHHIMLDLCDGSNALARGWDHATYVGLAAVIVAGLLFGLDERQLANALAIVAASNNMLLARAGKVSTWRSLAAPHAARNALFIAALAKASVSGPDPVFRGEQGFLESVSGAMTLELDPARDRSGDSHLKMYPAVFHAQAPIELALAVRRELVARHADAILAAQIESVEVATHAFAIRWAASRPVLWRPQNRETADHSIPFMVALALLRGDVSHRRIETALRDEEVMALTARVKVVEDAGYTRRWPREAPARLIVTTRKKRRIEEIEAGLGHAVRPLPDADRTRKLVTNATDVVGAARAAAWAEKLETFARLETLNGVLSP